MKSESWTPTQESINTSKVLIADDDEATRILLRMAMTQWGYQVIEAKDGEEAWEILQQPNPPQILTLDWLMPKLDGVSLCKRINEKLDYRPYIIFLTRMTGTENLILGLEAGADEFILKPFDLAELRIRVFAGERIIKYRYELIAQNKQLQSYVKNMKTLAEEYAKQMIPSSDLIAVLQEIHRTIHEVNDTLLEDKEKNFILIQKITDISGKLINTIDIIKNITKMNHVEPLIHHKQQLKTVPAELIVQKGESIINMQRMHAFFGNDNSAIQDFIKTFISLSTEQLKEIKNAIKNKDIKNTRYYFHLLGSASGNSGFMKMYEFCGKGEESVSKSDWNAVEECYQTLLLMTEKLKIELENLKK